MKHKANRINESTTTVSTVGAIHELPLQKDLPEGWVNTNLEDVVDILDRRRVPVNAEDREKRHGTIPYYGATGQVGWIDDYLFDEELVLLGEDGAPFLEPTKQKAYIIRGKSWVNNHAHVLRARNGIPNAYIKYYLDIVDYHKFVSGTTRLKLNQSAMRQITVPIAPPDQQKLIVAEIEKQFSRLDEAVTALKRIQANLKRYKASVLKAAVEGKLTEQWRKEHPDIEPASELLKRILTERRKKWEEDYVKKYVAAHGHAPKDDAWKKKYKEPASPDTLKLPELPKGWVWVSLDSICHQIGDVDHKMPKAKDSGIPYISTKDFLPAGEIDYENAKKIGQADYDKLCRKIFPENGDILLSRYGTVGEVRLIKTETLFQASYSIAVLKPVSENMSDFLSLVLQTEPIQTQIKKHTRATAQPDLGLAHIRLLGVPIAPTDERKRIIEEIDRLFSVTEEIEAIIQANTKRAERLRQSILRQVFKGKLINQEVPCN